MAGIFECGDETSGSIKCRGADKSLARPEIKEAAFVKSVMGRGMD